MSARLAWGLVTLAALACADSGLEVGGGPPPVARDPSCRSLDFPSGFGQTSSSLVNASAGPVLSMTGPQEEAFVAVWSVVFDQLLCSGTVIGPRLVLTAEHCVSSGDMEVRFGASARSPTDAVEVVNLRTHPSLDLALLELARSPELDLTPIPLATVDPEPELVGVWLETVGFGQSLRDFNQRGFLPVRVQSVVTDFLDVQGGGRQGLCFGDSGAPLLTLDPEQRDVRVWGVLSAGDPDCLGRDRFALIRRAGAFFAQTQTAPPGSPTCGTLSVEGACTPDGRRLGCTLEGASSETCAGGCGWDGVANVCTDGPVGDCQGPDRCTSDGTLIWCEQGRQRSRECGACGEVCMASDQGASCAHPLCDELGQNGRCAQDVVEWCDELGRFRQFDCRSVGQRCLSEPARCESVPEDCEVIRGGLCIDDVRIYCEGSIVLWDSCAALGRVCDEGRCI
ncbi:MAG: S1 family peptidase [Myxococcota bacterium]